MLNFNKTAAFYIRVSTEDQAEFSPDAQLRALKNFAENNGFLYNDRIIYIDEGYSARQARSRPAFMRMISDASHSPAPFDHILVHRFDRFARNREDSVIYKSMLKRHGVKVISATEHLEDDKFSIILESILEAMAEYYSMNLSDEVKKGMCEKARRGGLQSPPPYGYQAIQNQLEPVLDEAEKVREMFRLLLAGTAPPDIAQVLSAQGAKTKRGSPFSARAVRYILQNPAYIGTRRWSCGGSRFEIPDSHPAIIDKATYYAAQKIMSR